jgi:hypothetical protein
LTKSLLGPSSPSPSLIPADNEWSFVINFETVAIRFSCNSRETMVEWVECIRHKLGEMGILNPKGNLYSKVRKRRYFRISNGIHHICSYYKEI